VSLSRREFLQALATAAAGGFVLDAPSAARAAAQYELPRFGNVSLLHLTDTHAQLLPLYFREPSVNVGVGTGADRPPHLVGESLLRAFGVPAGTREAHAFTHLDFERAARRYGRMGGFAHIATLVKSLRASRPGALLLDGGDSWQGSAVSLWTEGRDMIAAQKLLGVEIMTGHWEFTYGAARVRDAVAKELGGIQFLAQNVETADFGDPVFTPWVLREIGGVPVAIIGQAFPYVPIAHPRRFVAEWSFGIQEERLQKHVDAARAKGAQVVVLLSHNGMDVDLKLAGRVTGIDAILGGHTHDGMPAPVAVANARGKTLVTNAGSNGKFLAVLDLDVRAGKLAGWRYRLLPVFADLLPADAAMAALVEASRAPYRDRLGEALAVTEGLLYRRGNFNGSFDQLIVDALMEVKDAELAFSPGFRWGPALLPGETITMERLMDQTAVTYPHTVVSGMTGEAIKTVLEDVCDNLFNPDPYYQQGGDMVRVGGMTYACRPTARMGSRISDMRLRGRPIEAGKTYRVASWAPVGEGVSGEPAWEAVARWLRARKRIAPRRLNRPRLEGVAGNRGLG
jgi:S-sulfosulfanyl-L-cysteine sulfohydrolase